ncbi:MAG: response regulator, partial [Firmicutes bacterium]|nr:response regulator [Bacillota bacterium]
MSNDFKQPLRVKRRVLIVDDEPINREIMGTFLCGSYDVIYAENGEEAISLMRENCETISIVILDLLMPVMDGYEVLKIRNGDEKLKKIPVIVLTSEKSSEIESLKLGASDFITKPYDMPEVIIARVERIIELFEDRSIINSVNEDELTGLFTKDFFIQYALQIERLDPKRDMDMIYLDVNHFHLINELYGRQFGKNVLKAIGEVIKEVSEENDGIGCRSYADCFYIYCRHREDHSDILERFRNRLSQMPNKAKVEIRMGIYSQVDKSSDMEICADRAKTACDTLRNDYTKFIAYYDEKLHEKNIYYEKLINNVHDAIKQKQFVVYYQPKYYIR